MHLKINKHIFFCGFGWFSDGSYWCRSWIEEEAKKGEARTKVLEEVGRRWKWGNRS